MGIKMGLGVNETLNSYPCEIMDSYASLLIAEGRAKEKHAYTFDEVLEWN